MRLLVAVAALLTLAVGKLPSELVAAVAAPDRPATARSLDASRKPVEVLAFLGLRKGDRVLDVMTGGGYYAEIIGRAVGPRGAVVALEPPASLDPKGRSAFAALTARVPNVRLLESLPGALTLPPASVDSTLLHLTYHDAY